MKENIGIKYSLIKNNYLTCEEVFTMIAISLAAEKTNKDGLYYVNYEDSIYFSLRKVYTRNDYTRFCLGLSALEKRGLFNVEEKINSHIVIAKVPFLVDKKDTNYILLEINEINRILDGNLGEAIRLLKFYIQLLSMRDGSKMIKNEYRFKIIHMPQWYIKKETGLNIKSIAKYLKTLEEKRVIAVSCPKNNSGAGRKKLSNFYSRYKDINILANYVDEIGKGRYLSPYGDFNEVSSIEKMNRSRSYLAKYRWFKEGKTYSREEVYQIKKACEEYNRKQLAKQKENLEKDMDFYPKLKDMSVFDDYDFSDLERMDQYKLPGVNPFV